MIFADRNDAGVALGRWLGERGLADAVVLGIPRGGVIVAAVAAREAGVDLDVIVPAKIRAPGQPELGLGAVAPDGTIYLDEQTVALLGVSEEYLAREVALRTDEIERRTRAYRGDREPLDIGGRPVVVVDDGVATGGTVICAARSLRLQSPSRLVVATPVAPKAVVPRLEREADEVVCLHTPEPFVAVGQWYRDFTQVTDEEVVHALRERSR